MKRLILLLVILIFSFSVTFPVKAESSSLYLFPSSGSFLVGSTFTVSIFLNTEGSEINVVWADLKFPPEILQITSPTTGSSFISEWIIPPNYSNERGIISFRGGVPGGIITSAGLVSSITFRAVSSGKARIEFSEESKVLLNDGKGTDILVDTRGGEYQILIPPPEGPKVFSPTHPNSNIWYSDSSPSFSWEKEKGVTNFSWSFDQNPQGRPDGISEGDKTLVSFSEVKDGIWYFHIRQKKEGIWGKTTNVPIRIDTAPPNDFSPRVETYSRLVGYQTMVYFETKDNFSGVDHYEINIIDLSVFPSTQSFFAEVTSPYKVPFQEAGKYNVIIRAIDRAGNIRESETRFRSMTPLITHIELMTPLITHIEGKGLEIRGVLFSWWLIGILIFIFIFVIGIIIWQLVKKYTAKHREY